MNQKNHRNQKNQRKQKKNKKLRFLRNLLIILSILTVLTALLFGTRAGRKIFYRYAANLIHSELNEDTRNEKKPVNVDIKEDETVSLKDIGSGNYPVRKDEDIMNFLLFGLEEIKGAKNTDSMMIVSLDKKAKKIKMTSLMRDSYVEIPGYRNNKLNSAYARGGLDLMVDTIEHNYKVGLSGYGSVNFEAFEKIIDQLGGVEIELSQKEADYLNSTNYISNKNYRNVKAGFNTFNGNQALGYCRVREIPTIEGVGDDYGRTLRQRKVLNAIFDKYRSANIFKLIQVTKQCLGYITTDLSEEVIAMLLEEIVENKITILEQFRLPINNAFEDPRKYEGIGYPLLYDWDTNLKEFFMFLYGDTQEEAARELEQLRSGM